MDTSIDKPLNKLKKEIDDLKTVLKDSSPTITLDCLNRIINLQIAATDLQKKMLNGKCSIEATLICDATCTFCEKAIKEISITGCSSGKCNKNKKSKKCKIHKLFDSFYELFK